MYKTNRFAKKHPLARALHNFNRAHENIAKKYNCTVSISARDSAGNIIGKETVIAEYPKVDEKFQ